MRSRIVGALVLVPALLISAFLAVSVHKAEEPLSRYEALALRMDEALDSLPVRKIEPSLDLWMYEIAPYFYYEGLISEPKYPAALEFSLFPNEANFHVLGRAACSEAGGGPIQINARGVNHLSRWNMEAWLLPTLIHEMIHVQGGGFCSGLSQDLESTTQMGTLEVLAAMANHGNMDAAYALIDELRDMAMSAAYYEALRDGETDRYMRLRDRVYSEASEKARAEKSRRHWWATPQSKVNLKDVLNKYSFIPMSRVLDGLEAGEIPNLRLGLWKDERGHGTWRQDQAQGNEPRALKIDDLAYFISHLDGFATELRKAKPLWQ